MELLRSIKLRENKRSFMKASDLKVEKLGKSTIASPLKNTFFEKENSSVIYQRNPDHIIKDYKKNSKIMSLEKAGPREKIFFDPSWSRAAIVTAGGLCPGLNDVIKGLTLTLKARYKVPLVYGIRYGYEGLNPAFGHEPMILDERTVDSIHDQGGTILGSSRGRQPEDIMVDTLVRRNINILFCIGGDGTLRCAHDIALEVKKRGLSISIIGIPKTIDNDINLIDKTFGFETAVYATNPVITAAHNEAEGARNGVSLVHVMGRDSGFIAAYSTLANSHVNYCLVPEEKFSLYDGPKALLPALKERLAKRQHAVIVVAEGAGQELFAEADGLKDKSGNKLHQDIGQFLKEEIKKGAKKLDFDVNIKYFDPSYMIRSLPAHGTDAVFCLMLAQNAVHAAMAGRTDVVVGHWSDTFTNVPIPLTSTVRKKIEVDGSLWRSVSSVTWPKYN